MDYRDLIQYGTLDLERAEFLFKNEDYALSAFCAQQGLEKVLKGYLLKNQIFENLSQLNHLQYPKIIEQLIQWIKGNITNEQSSPEFMNDAVQMYEFIKKILNEINESQEKKIITWKNSLNIPLTKQEQNISDGIDSQFFNHLKIIQKSTLDYFTNVNLELTDQEREQMNEKEKTIVDTIYSMKKNTLEMAKNQFETDDNHVLNDMKKLLDVVSYGTGKDSLTKEDTREMKKFVKIQESFQWLWPVVDSYPHVTIGRYPILIDEKDPIELYKENKEHLWEFIQTINKTCVEIKNTVEF